MRDRRSKIYQMDDTLRLIFAFYSCTSNNSDWILESEFSKHNREVAKKLYPEIDLFDYCFCLNDYFYGFNVEKIDEETIYCTMEEYECFYDFSDSHLVLSFSYNIPSKTIIDMEEVNKVGKLDTLKQYKKVA